MAGLYIHIPFCKSRCIYCGFYSTTLLGMRERYVNALCREMEMRPCNVDTVYLGGGTPSLLTARQLERLFIYINKVYGPPLPSQGGAGGGSEVTIECNPDDVTQEFARTLLALPVNRVSLGAQTFSDERLRYLRRRHTADQVERAVRNLRSAGIGNISIDLMFGFPGETLEDWRSDVKRALSLDVEHISAYSLMIEEGTELYEKMNAGLLGSEDDELSREMYESLMDQLSLAGYEHYEISNWARPGFRSRHNSSYWQDIPYVGLGAAAHSYDLRTRSWNAGDVLDYIRKIEQGVLPSEKETLDDATRYNDLVTTALRTREGIRLERLHEPFRSYLLKNARRSLSRRLLILEDNRIHLSREGLFVSDDVMSDLIFIKKG